MQQDPINQDVSAEVLRIGNLNLVAEVWTTVSIVDEDKWLDFKIPTMYSSPNILLFNVRTERLSRKMHKTCAHDYKLQCHPSDTV